MTLLPASVEAALSDRQPVMAAMDALRHEGWHVEMIGGSIIVESRVRAWWSPADNAWLASWL